MAVKKQKINARSKGASGEREACKWLFTHTEIQDLPERNLDQVRNGGSDIELPPFCFEVKRVENLDLLKAWIQCKTAAESNFLEPVVMFRKNRKPWSFLISARHIGCGMGYILLDERTFKFWVEGVWSSGELA